MTCFSAQAAGKNGMRYLSGVERIWVLVIFARAASGEVQYSPCPLQDKG
jgi:hypothetical protein